jgi:uncharacterized Zn-binding protein involved in type VI secretion
MVAPAARKGDRVAGADTHVVLVPSPGGPVPTPLYPHQFAGQITSGTSTDVTIEGQAAATVGSVAENKPKHVPLPPGTSFQRPPSNKGTVSAGSATVTVNGQAAARLGDAVRTCNDPKDLDAATVVSGARTVTVG